MLKYYLWNIGCQMNKAESERLAACAESLGYSSVPGPHGADLVVMNTCVVRGSAEGRVLGELSYLKGLKKEQPCTAIAVTGCFVEADTDEMKRRFPHVDRFFPAGEHSSFRDWLAEMPRGETSQRTGPESDCRSATSYVPIMQGCNNFCSYCIVPFRRGRERSRPPYEVVREVEGLVSRGVREVTLLGQNVNSYGRDLAQSAGLGSLLEMVNGVRGLFRARYLTSHPRDVDRGFIDALAGLDKVCEWINLPVQAGDDRILAKMRRGYTASQYQSLVAELRERVPGIAISTDVIVGFPGETEAEFNRTTELLSDLRLDAVHVAAYSPRPGTLAANTMADDVSPLVKASRLRLIEEMQEQICLEIDRALVGTRVEVLVERKNKGKWEGRTRTNKLVFFVDLADWQRRLATIEITSASPWSLQGKLALETEGVLR
ncbi:MAG: tRNA (N6-isopentenyl adenosine(37)-C2)-methylthiotransferase MiaB [Dehalococcoidia bacterium]|nr:tRNA (N6-isopentenyl adenosine(37)-C2)-methylthiotransferase MiaB [Dehalococcoidia bacterium]